jgi:hypothetical protein
MIAKIIVTIACLGLVPAVLWSAVSLAFAFAGIAAVPVSFSLRLFGREVEVGLDLMRLPIAITVLVGASVLLFGLLRAGSPVVVQK